MFYSKQFLRKYRFVKNYRNIGSIERKERNYENMKK